MLEELLMHENKLNVPHEEGFPHHLKLAGGAYGKYLPYSEVSGLFFKVEPSPISPLATAGTAGHEARALKVGKSRPCCWDQARSLRASETRSLQSIPRGAAMWCTGRGLIWEGVTDHIRR